MSSLVLLRWTKLMPANEWSDGKRSKKLRGSVLDCASPLALSEIVTRAKAVEDYRSPRRCRAVSYAFYQQPVC